MAQRIQNFASYWVWALKIILPCFKYEQTLICRHFGRLMPFDLSRWDWIASGHLLFSQSSINFTSMHLTPNLSALNFWYFLVWLELKEKSQPKKSFYFLQPLFENIFRHIVLVSSRFKFQLDLITTNEDFIGNSLGVV